MKDTRSTWRERRIGAAAVCLLALAGCLSPPPPATTEVLDETTGNTYTAVAEPYVFSRQRTDVAANSRDYVTLAAAHVNRAGALMPCLIAWRWATVDLRVAPLPPASAGRLVITGDGAPIELKPSGDRDLLAILPHRLHAPVTPVHVAWVYPADAALLARLAAAGELTLEFPDEATPLPFTVWRSGQAALQEFAARVQP